MTDNDLSENWADFLKKAVTDYHLFAAQPSPTDAKEFIAHHNACKAVLSHILMLKKMMESETQKQSEPDLFSLLEQAREATHEQDNDDSFD